MIGQPKMSVPVGTTGRLRRHIVRHWAGSESLVIAFWVNFILLGALVYAGQVAIQSIWITRDIAIVVVYFLLFRVVLFVWQAVGLSRVCEQALASYRNSTWIRSAQLSLLAGFALLLIDTLALMRTMVLSHQVPSEVVAAPDESKGYSVSLSDDRETVEIRGVLDFGVTAALNRLLLDNATIRQVVLNSSGGQVYEARGLATLIERHRLTTVADTLCKSACTIVFIAGEDRRLRPDAQLGFHSYRLDTRKQIPFVDPVGELARDIEYFRAKGVSEAFLSRIAETSPSNIWFPTVAELESAGFITDASGPAFTDDKSAARPPDSGED